MTKIHPIFLFILGGFFFILDRFLKYTIFLNQNHPHYIWKPWIGWEYFANSGVAFGIPIPWFASFLYTPLIFLGLILYYKKKKKPNVFLQIAYIFIFFGAASNLIDRIVYHFTIDYFRIFTSILNIADIMIVIGAFLFFYEEIKIHHKRENQNYPQRL